MNRTCTVLQQGLTMGDREDRGEPFVHRASIARFFSMPVLPGQRRQRHDPSRSFPVDLRCQHGSTRFTQVGLPFPVLQGSPRLFLTCQKPPERPPVHLGPSGIIPVHHGGLRFNPPYSPVHPGPWTGVNRGVPGAQWDWGIRQHVWLWNEAQIKNIVNKIHARRSEHVYEKCYNCPRSPLCMCDARHDMQIHCIRLLSINRLCRYLINTKHNTERVPNSQ